MLPALCAPWEGWRVVVLKVPVALHWQDVSMQCMVMVSCFCEQSFLHEVDDLACADVDMKFCDHVDMEILPPSLAPCTPFCTGCPMKTSAISAGHSSMPTSPGTRAMLTT